MVLVLFMIYALYSLFFNTINGKTEGKILSGVFRILSMLDIAVQKAALLLSGLKKGAIPETIRGS